MVIFPQDNYFEEAFKMRNVLEEFLKRQRRRPTILGLREHIFTGRFVIPFEELTDTIITFIIRQLIPHDTMLCMH